MLKSCQLFENGGNYDEAEVQWYQTQMDEINEMIAACKTKRLGEVEGLLEEMKRLGVEPEEEFTGEYKHSIEELSAKDGLGTLLWPSNPRALGRRDKLPVQAEGGAAR